MKFLLFIIFYVSTLLLNCGTNPVDSTTEKHISTTTPEYFSTPYIKWDTFINTETKCSTDHVGNCVDEFTK